MIEMTTSSDHDARIEALIGEMTLEEKAGQLTAHPNAIRPLMGINPDRERSAEALKAKIRAGEVGTLFNGLGVAEAAAAQRIALEETRLGIPLLFAADVIHGYATVFPIPLGEAASFDPDLAERTARAAAMEAAANAVHQVYAPMVDVARDQRWGRVAEGAGEDVVLGSAFAAARVRGFQGTGLAAADAVLATPKHFAAYGAVSGGMEYNSVDISPQTLWETHLPPFRAAFQAGALSTMTAFHDLNGVPATGDPALMTGVLRGDLGFAGFVVSDFTADEELIAHGFAADGRDAARIALTAGVDSSMASGLYEQHLPDLVRSGEVPLKQLDEAVRRLLRVKAALGLFDNPYKGMDPAAAEAALGRQATAELAREAARRSIVMLKNQGGLLPLDPAARIALIGPMGDDLDNIFGPWTLFGDAASRRGLDAAMRVAMADPDALTVVKGADFEAPIEGGIEAAVAAARQADVVVLAIGESRRMSGEAQSRTEIVVPAPQQALAEAVSAIGKPMVVLLSNGRALALEGAVREAGAILVTWFLGSQSGPAIADILFGAKGPSGRLPVSFPQAAGQQPLFYDRKSTGRPETPGAVTRSGRPVPFKARYRETPNAPLYPFGHGLTYGEVVYERLYLPAELAWDGAIEIAASLRNIGARAAEEVAQLYVHDRVASRTRPIRQLKGFAKLALAPGETAQIRFTLTRADLTFPGADLSPTVEPGTFDLWIAPSAKAEGVSGTFELLRPSV
jgi:beta-glucosidase